MYQAAALPRLPAARLEPLLAALSAARRQARRRLWLSSGLVLALLLLAGWVAQVEPGKLWLHGGGFFGYFDRLLTLETGDHVGQRVWRDPAEWFWGRSTGWCCRATPC
jgi:phosphonate transport system permease protein